MTSIHQLSEPEHHVGDEQPTSTEEVNSDRDSISSLGSNASVFLKGLQKKLTDLESRLHRSSSNLAKVNNTPSDSAYGSDANTPRIVLSPGRTTFVDVDSHDGSVIPSAPTSEAPVFNPDSSSPHSDRPENTSVRTPEDSGNTSAGGDPSNPSSSEPSAATGHQSVTENSNTSDTPPSLPLDTRMAVRRDTGGPYPQNDHEEFDLDYEKYGLRPPRRKRKKSRRAHSSTIPDNASVRSLSYLENIGSIRKNSLQRTHSVRRKPVAGSVRSASESYERDFANYLNNPYAETDERKLPTRLEWERGKPFPSVDVSPSLPAAEQSSNDNTESNHPEVEPAPPVETPSSREESPSGRSSRASSLFESFSRRSSSRTSLGHSISENERPSEASVGRFSAYKRIRDSFKGWKSKVFPSRPEYDTPTGGYHYSGLLSAWYGDPSERIPIKLAEYPEPIAPLAREEEDQTTSQPPQTVQQPSSNLSVPSTSGTAEQGTDLILPRRQGLAPSVYDTSIPQRDGDTFWIDFGSVSNDDRNTDTSSVKESFDTPMEYKSINDYLQDDEEKSIWTEYEAKSYAAQITFPMRNEMNNNSYESQLSMGDQNSKSHEPQPTIGDETKSRQTEIVRRKEVIERLRSKLEIEKEKLTDDELSVWI